MDTSQQDIEATKIAARPRPAPWVGTEIPGPKSREWIQREQQAETGGNAYPDFFGMGMHSPVFVGEEGSLLRDVDGNSYVESSGCYSCGTFGYLPSDLIETAVQTMRELVHVPDVPTRQRIEAAEAILSIAPGSLQEGRVQFELGGGGAMDLAYKMAFYHASSTKPYSSHVTIAFGGNYHGRTVATLSLTSSTHAQENMPTIAHNVVRFPFPYCYRCPYGKQREDCELFCVQFVRQHFESDAYALYNPHTGKCQASIMVWEPIQAHIGMVFPPDEFFSEMRKLCDDYGLILIDDEIAMGVGHTGEWFAAQTYHAVPDIIALAKALTGGVWPLGAVVASKDVSATWGATPDKHMGSYHGNPVGCAVASKNIELLKKHQVLANVREQAAFANERIADLMTRHPLIGEGKAVGLAIGMELVKDRASKEPAPDETLTLAKECLKRGLLVLRLGYFGNRLNLMPSLDSSRAEMEFIFDTLDESLSVAESVH